MKQPATAKPTAQAEQPATQAAQPQATAQPAQAVEVKPAQALQPAQPAPAVPSAPTASILNQINLSEYEVSDGFDDFSESDSRPAMVVIVSSQHPQTKKGDAAYIQDCQEGDFLKTLDGQLWKAETGIKVIPFAHRHEWIEREKISDTQYQFRGAHLEGSHVVKAALRGEYDDVDAKGNRVMVLQNGHYLREVENFFCVIVDDFDQVSFTNVVLNFTPGHFANVRKWNTALKQQFYKTGDGKMKRLPVYLGVWHLTTAYYKPSSGGTGYQSLAHRFLGTIEQVIGLNDPTGQVTRDQILTMLALRKSFQEDKIQANYDASQDVDDAPSWVTEDEGDADDADGYADGVEEAEIVGGSTANLSMM